MTSLSATERAELVRLVARSPNRRRTTSSYKKRPRTSPRVPHRAKVRSDERSARPSTSTAWRDCSRSRVGALTSGAVANDEPRRRSGAATRSTRSTRSTRRSRTRTTPPWELRLRHHRPSRGRSAREREGRGDARAPGDYQERVRVCSGSPRRPTRTRTIQGAS